MLVFQITLALLAGMAVGVWFFGGLLWTLHRLPQTRHPLAWVFASLVVRVAVLGIAIVLLARQHWSLPASALLGLLVVRQRMLATQARRRPADSWEFKR